MTSPARSTHLIGAALVLGSAVAFSLAGVLTKAISADVWTILCWRGLIGGGLVTLYVLARPEVRGRTNGGAETGVQGGARLRLGWRGWTLATVGAAASLAFIAAFKLTYVGNVAIIYAAVPFMAAGLERIALGAPTQTATIAAAGLSLAGVAIMVSAGFGTDRWLGDLVAVLMTFLNALYMVLIRCFRGTPVVFAGAVSAFQLVAIGWLVGDPLAVGMTDALLMVAFGASWAVAVVLWTEGARLIPAAESGLLGSAEAPAAILFAWLLLSELPPAASFIGGGIVLAAVLAHAGWDFARGRGAG